MPKEHAYNREILPRPFKKKDFLDRLSSPLWRYVLGENYNAPLCGRSDDYGIPPSYTRQERRSFGLYIS